MTKILVTGATGFLGKALCLSLTKEGYEVRGTYRTAPPIEPEFQKIEWVKIPDLLPTEIWNKPLEGCDIVIHSAARVHQMNATKKDEEQFYIDNVLGTKALAEAILQNRNIKQLIFISTILVYGKSQKMPLNQNQECLPDTPYGKSKLAAETLLQNLLQESSVSWTIFRPSVMYGENNKGNMMNLEKFIRKGIPLPVKGLKNKRSFLSVDNMCSYISASLLNKNAQNKIFCAADPEPISTENLVLILASSLNKKAKLIRVPFLILYIMALIFNIIQKFGVKTPWNSESLAKISGDFWFDVSRSVKELNMNNLLPTKDAFKKIKPVYRFK